MSRQVAPTGSNQAVGTSRAVGRPDGAGGRRPGQRRTPWSPARPNHQAVSNRLIDPSDWRADQRPPSALHRRPGPIPQPAVALTLGQAVAFALGYYLRLPAVTREVRPTDSDSAGITARSVLRGARGRPSRSRRFRPAPRPQRGVEGDRLGVELVVDPL